MNYEGVRVKAFEFIRAGLIVNDPKCLPWLLRPRRVFQLFQPALSLSRAASHIL